MNQLQNTTEYRLIEVNLLDEFIKYLDVSPKTIETYTRALKQFWKYLSMNQTDKPTRQDIITYRDTLKATCKNTTVQAYMVAVRRFFKWCNQMGYYPNVAEDVKGAKVSKEFKKDYLTSSQSGLLLETMPKNTLDDIRNYAIVYLMLVCGLRTIEVSRANVMDLTTLGDHTVLYIQGKGKEDKAMYCNIPIGLEQVLRTYITTRQATADEPLFTSSSNNSHGQRLSTRTIRGIAKKSMQDIGLDSERLTAHSLRHTAVTLALLGHESLQDVSMMARHNNLNTTMIYNHAIEMSNNTCSQTVEKMIKEKACTTTIHAR